MDKLNFQSKRVMVALATLTEVEKCLRFLATVGVVQEDSIVKGCKKNEQKVWGSGSEHETATAEVTRLEAVLESWPGAPR